MAAHPEGSRLGVWNGSLSSSMSPSLALGWFVEKDGGPEGTQTAPGLHPAAFLTAATAEPVCTPLLGAPHL